MFDLVIGTVAWLIGAALAVWVFDVEVTGWSWLVLVTFIAIKHYHDRKAKADI